MINELKLYGSRFNPTAPIPGTDDSPIYRFVRAIFEGVVLLVIIIGIEVLFFGRGTYVTLDVHPFWIVVLLVTLQHGLYSGVVTAVLAAMMLDWPVRPPGLDIADYYLELARLPVQWIAAALLLGAYRQSQIRLDEQRVCEIAHLKAINDCIADEVARLDNELWQFEVAAAVSSGAEAKPLNAVSANSTAIEALIKLAALRAAKPSEVGARFAACTAALFEDVPVRLYRCNKNGDFVAVPPGQSTLSFGTEVKAEHPAVRGALAPEEINPQALGADGVIVIALRCTHDASLCGLMVTECVGKSKVASALAEGLRLVAAAATVALCAVDAPSTPRKSIGMGQGDE